MRLVSLCPSLTELVFALGRGGDLVAITRFCVRPADGVAGIETVGGTKSPDVERIVELAPDLVLLNREENRRADAEAIAAAGLACHSSFPRDAEGAAAAVREVGRLVGRERRAGAIAEAIERRLAGVRRRARGLPPVRFAYLVWRRPWMAAGGDTYVHALFAAAGGENVFAGRAERYPAVGVEALAAARPAAVFLASEPYPFAERHVGELAAAAGLPTARCRRVDGELLHWHGPRTPDALDYAEGLVSAAREPGPGFLTRPPGHR